MKRFSLILLLLIASTTFYAQSYNSNFNQFEIKSHYGFTIPHHEKMKYLINSNIGIVEINYSIKTDGSKPWQHDWRFPEMGAGYLIGGLGNINTFGFSQSLFWFFGVPVMETDRVLLKYRIGTGIAYLSEKYDYRSNYYNIVIGSHINAHLHFSLLCDIRPFELPLYISAGFAYNHFSNGAIETPNLGINQVSTSLGIKYMYSMYDYSLPKRQLQYMYNSELEFSAYYAGSIKENSTYENKKYFINSISVDAGSRLTKKRSIGGGINFIFDPSLKTLMEDKYNNFTNLFRVGIHAYHELYFTDKLSMPFYLGTYILNFYKPENKKIWIYSKLGIRYTFNELIFVNVILKTHTSVADYIEFGVGIRLY